MRRVPQLNWPARLYAQPYSTANSTAPLLRSGKSRTDDHLCACGCGKMHHLAISGLEGEQGARRVLWFATMSCKSRYLGTGM
jgi:hypothetical protein